jgi:acyl-CoA thioesterase-1
MNPVVLYFASGESLYPGAAILLIVIAISPLLRSLWLVRLRNISAWFALIMIVMACPPFPWIVDAAFLATFLLWHVGTNLTAYRKATRPAAAILAALLIILSGLELRHRDLPLISGAPGDHVVVIGDSISAGIDPRVPTWPVVMEETLGVPVKNLSSAGAFTTDGLRMAPKVAQEDQVILIEIGGNDLIAGAPSSQFASSLEALLKKVTAPGRTVVMFELPLLPDRIAYGQVQRRLAKKYGVWLIPKRYFVSVIGGANATSDGLHLLPEGTRRMADLVAQVLAPVLKPARPAA